MCKVSKSWLKNNGFIETVYKNVHEYHNYMQEVINQKQTVYGIYFKDRWARFDCYYYVTTNKYGDKRISRYYMFTAYNQKTHFKVENSITYSLPTREQMRAACLVCGISLPY